MELRRNALLLEADRAELRKMLEQAHSAVNTLQIERDELKQALVETQALSVLLPAPIASTKQDGSDVKSDMKELNARMIALTDELTQLKQRFSSNARGTSGRTSHESPEHVAKASPGHVVRDATTQPRIIPSTHLLAPVEAAPRLGHASALSIRQSVIRIQPGDSLSKLAYEHATTIAELRRINGLTTDVVRVGQRLILSSPVSTHRAP